MKSCQLYTIDTDVFNRALNISHLIPRSSYNIIIRADSQDFHLNEFSGSLTAIIAESAAPRGW